MRIGPSKNGQHDCAPHQNLLTSQAESNHETTAQETVSPKIHLSHKDNERGPHPGYDGVKSITIVPGSEETRDESPVKWESPLRTVLQMDQDSVVDPPVSQRLLSVETEHSFVVLLYYNLREINHSHKCFLTGTQGVG